MTNQPVSSRHVKTSLGCLLLLLIGSAVAHGQQVSNIPDGQWLNRYPKKQYYQGLEFYRDGDIRTATQAFESALAACIGDKDGLWIDAIPVHAMLAECAYQAGDLRRALLHSEASLSLLNRQRLWIDAIDWSAINPRGFAAPDARSAWVTQNQSRLLALPVHLAIRVRDVQQTQAAAGGPITAVAGQAAVDGIEILRGAATAGYRRRLILAALAEPSSRLAEAARGKGSDALTPLPRTLLAAVEQCVRFAGSQPQTVQDLDVLAALDQAIHPLTPVLLLTAARLANEQDQAAEATVLAGRAAETASLLGQSEWVAEALMLAIGCCEAQAAGKLRISASAAAVGYLRRGRLASVGALLAASEAASLDEDAPAAEQLLLQARSLLQRRDLMQPRLAAHADYLAARLAARLGQSLGGLQLTAADEAVQRVLVFADGPQGGPRSPTTPRRFQANLALARARQRGADAAQTQRLLQQLSDDPPTWLWRADPVDALAWHGIDRSPLITAALELAMQRDAAEDLLVLCDALLRARFLAQLPLGGRIAQVRHIASADPGLLVGPAAGMRASPGDDLQRLIELIAKSPAAARRPATHRELLESLATEIALGRIALPAAVPPAVADPADILRLPEGHGMLIYIDLGGQFLGLLVQPQRVDWWSIASSRTVATEVTELLRGIGVADVTAKARIAAGAPWRQAAAKLRRRLVPAEPLAELTKLKHLIVVPDGVLWYLPLELLPLSDPAREDGKGGGEDVSGQLWADRIAIRYSASPGLTLAPRPRPAAAGPTGLVCGTLLAPHDAALNAQRLDRVANAAVAVRRLPAQADAAIGRSEAATGVLAVLADNQAPVGEPLALTPLPSDIHDPLSQWLRLPMQAPRSVMLPGLRTAAAATPIGDGRELFMTLTALRCSGAQEVLLSRWVVGGESTTSLIGELLQEMPHAGMQPAWQRSVQLLRSRSLDPRSEPLLSGQDLQGESVSGDHPLFWSGYLLDVAAD